MKLDSVFKVIDNKLFRISDDTEENPSLFSVVDFFQSDIELDEEVYNEEQLAVWREEFLSKDEKGEFLILAPHSNLDLSNALNFERFLNTCNHTARRVKDCKSVAGFLFDETFLSENTENRIEEFINLLSKKHSQYVYFVSKSVAENFNFSNNFQNKIVIL
ncbi:MAG: hypothetical protein HUK25_05495 [Treponema sp.]|nr:hypothetical protein [Treponema sp.]